MQRLSMLAVMALAGAALLAPGAEAQLVQNQVVTFVKSSVATQRSATVITVLNSSDSTCNLRLDFFPAFNPDDPACRLTTAISPGTAVDFCSRSIPTGLTSCNHSCSADFAIEGKAVLFATNSAACRALRVDARIYYTTGTADQGLAAISNPLVHR